MMCSTSGNHQSHPLTEEQVQTYRDRGYVVVRGLFGNEKIERISESLMRAVRRDHGEPERARRYTLMTNVVEDPVLAAQASDPQIVDAAQTLLGGPAVLATFVAYLKTPGAAGTKGPYVGPHARAHHDYKPRHNAGSSLNWLFAIMPMVDLDEKTGALYVSPGSHKLSRVIDDGGRVRRVERATADDIAPLVDTELRCGDLLLMNMFTWHGGGANQSDHNRLGIYNKYRAANAPPACGPIVFSEAAHRAVVCRGRSLLPHRSDRPIRAARLVLEHDDGFLLIKEADRSGGNGNRWTLPSGVVDGQPFDAAKQDSSRLILADGERHVEMPWLSYIGDFDESGNLCRVFGCTLPDSAGADPAAWFTKDQIADLDSGGRLAGGYEMVAIDRWLDGAYLRGMDCG